MNNSTPIALEAWDPLSSDSDPGILVAAQRREIRNILKSYTGYYDLFSELIQNALDAVERRLGENDQDYEPAIWIRIDIPQSEVAVTDNGCGMSESEFKQFLRPNFSFKQSNISRGSKGVGATYLAYGFNHLGVATRVDSKTLSGVILRGREWVEDRTDSVSRPKVEKSDLLHGAFDSVDRGSSMLVKLTGTSIRPRDLSWVGADTADQWLAVLRVTTPLGGVQQRSFLYVLNQLLSKMLSLYSTRCFHLDWCAEFSLFPAPNTNNMMVFIESRWSNRSKDLLSQTKIH